MFIFIYVCVYIYIYIHIHVYIYMYICVYIYIHTHIHKYVYMYIHLSASELPWMLSAVYRLDVIAPRVRSIILYVIYYTIIAILYLAVR